MNIFTFPYLILGSFLGPASILVFVAGLGVSWRYGILGTLAQQVLVVLIVLGIYILYPDIKGTIGQRFSAGGFIGIIVNLGILPFNLVGFVGRAFTKEKAESHEAANNKGCSQVEARDLGLHP